jgi:ferredoxin-NADP reductase
VPADRYQPVRVKRVTTETDDAKSIVFDVPPALAAGFAYRPGQFITLRVVVAGRAEVRSYSMSSAPSVDADLQVTVKRVPGGLVSNWLNDSLLEGDELEVSSPTGAFVLDDTERSIVAFAGGSGITPVFAIVKEALHHSERNVRLLFANHDRSAAIFGDQLDQLAAGFSGRLIIHHHEDATSGFVQPDSIRAFVAECRDASFYVCGPAGFMNVVNSGLRSAGVDDARIHLEHFTPAPPVGDANANDPVLPAQSKTVTITVGTQTKTIDQRGDDTILQSARWGGLRPPSSCEAGHCATCMARIVEGEVRMANNEVLTREELTAGWVLTCQAVPVTPVVRVVYE